jgi:hypothetical protein
MATKLSSLLLMLAACAPPVGDTSTGDTAGDTGGGGTDTGTDTDTVSDTGDTGSDTDDTGGDTGRDTADTGGDTGKDTGDTGVDTGKDTGDTGADTGKDTGDPGDTGSTGACTEADLLLTAEVRDSAGVAGTSFGPRDSLSMVAVLSNPCAVDVTFTTSADCLFTGWSVEDSRGAGTGVGVACAAVVTSWTVPAGGSLEGSQSWGTMRVDTYVLTVTADVPAGKAATKFSVI